MSYSWQIRISHNKFSVFAVSKILEVSQVIHKSFIFEIFALSEDCVLDTPKGVYNSDSADLRGIGGIPDLLRSVGGQS